MSSSVHAAKTYNAQAPKLSAHTPNSAQISVPSVCMDGHMHRHTYTRVQACGSQAVILHCS